MIPTEDKECEQFAKWLNSNGYKFTHIGNESGQKGTINIIRMMAKKQRLGVSKGVPDYMIILKRGSLLFIEMKRQRKLLKSGKLGASPSDTTDPNQLEWIDKLESIPNVGSCMCFGFDEAKRIVLEKERIEELEEFILNNK